MKCIEVIMKNDARSNKILKGMQCVSLFLTIKRDRLLFFNVYERERERERERETDGQTDSQSLKNVRYQRVHIL